MFIYITNLGHPFSPCTSSSTSRIIPRYWKFIQVKVRRSTEAGITFLVQRLVTGWRSEVRAQVGRDFPYPSGQTMRYLVSFASVGGPDAYIYSQMFLAVFGTESWWVDSLKSKPWTRVDFIGTHGAICQDLSELYGCMMINVKQSTWERWHVNPTKVKQLLNNSYCFII